MAQSFNKNIVYTICRLKTVFNDDIGNEKNGCETGFFVGDKEKNITFLVTNRHVLDPSKNRNIKNGDKYKLKKLECMLHEYKNEEFAEGTIFYPIDLSINEIKFHNNSDNDIAVIKLEGEISSVSIKRDMKHYGLCGIIVEDFAAKEDFEKDMQIGDFVTFIGYPENWWDNVNMLPIARFGIIASQSDKNYGHSKKGISGECLLLDSNSFAGSSGSPVILTQVGFGTRGAKVIGIMAGDIHKESIKLNGNYIGEIRSGLGYMYKSYAIKEVIDLFDSKDIVK